MASLHLQNIPGFSDLPSTALAADQPAFGLHVEQISDNAAFGMVALEVFQGFYVHGDTVPLPVSGVDGYIYSRSECLYLWAVAYSTNPQSNWITGPDSLWFCNWDVDQTTGDVFSEEWYRRSGNHMNQQKSNDGILQVWTIAQRRRTTLAMTSTAAYDAITAGWIATDEPLSQQLAQGLNDDAKFATVSTEVFYMGEFVNGDTVPLPVSPVDGYTYSYAEIAFQFAWRWTTLNSAYVQPPITSWPFVGIEQLGPFFASINASTGAVSVSVDWIYNGGEDLINLTTYGRIAVFAFCRRSATPGTLPLASSFTELDPSFFFPGETLRASTVQKISDNINEAILTPEFFGPTTYKNGDTIPLPTSPVDGYSYSNSEITMIWSWSDTTNQTGSHLRLPLFTCTINPTTRLVTLQTWRLPPGGPYVDDDNTRCRINVIVVAHRQANHGTVTAPGGTVVPTGASSVVVDVNNIEVNGVSVPDIANFNDTLPAAPSGVNVKWQMDSSVDPGTISAYLPTPTVVSVSATANPGNVSVAHGLGRTPILVILQMTSDGIIRFQSPTKYDSTNVYLSASDSGLTCDLLLW
jgi:hypothetical protein